MHALNLQESCRTLHLGRADSPLSCWPWQGLPFPSGSAVHALNLQESCRTLHLGREAGEASEA